MLTAEVTSRPKRPAVGSVQQDQHRFETVPSLSSGTETTQSRRCKVQWSIGSRVCVLSEGPRGGAFPNPLIVQIEGSMESRRHTNSPPVRRDRIVVLLRSCVEQNIDTGDWSMITLSRCRTAKVGIGRLKSGQREFSDGQASAGRTSCFADGTDRWSP